MTKSINSNVPLHLLASTKSFAMIHAYKKAGILVSMDSAWFDMSDGSWRFKFVNNDNEAQTFELKLGDAWVIGGQAIKESVESQIDNIDLSAFDKPK